MAFKCHSNQCKIAAFDVVILAVATLLCFSHSAVSDPRISEVGLYCGTHRASPSGNYVPVFTKEMGRLQELVSKNNWGTHSEEPSSTSPIYGLAQCFQDLSNIDCLQCFAASRTKLPRCVPSVSGHIYLDGCFLRYDNYSFYSEDTDPLRDTVNCTTQYGGVAGEAEVVFGKSVGKVVENVVRVAVNEGRGFAVGEGEGVYALAQCWKTVGEKGCGDCLKKAGNEVRGCLPKKEGRALNSGCYLRYSTVKFYNQGGEHGDGDDSSRKRTIITAVSILAAVVVIWKLYQSNRLAEAVDPCLGDEFPEREASRVFQIGLLCTQASASLRPSMAQVACMLSNSNLDVPIPKQPPFLNSRLLSQTAPLGFSMDNSSSNTFQKIGVSYSPSQSSSSCSLIRPCKSEETILEA
ncbi:Cysteine-rich receptor-like protein [Vigna angularis]|uniref:Cysteine-rich receptor-like protein n=1 Tax=Phaseolus angularis TaxID=3914 RepID=A0A8T0JVZ7_PHAAN|nr:Cysteine-rich receptor-like protein [Vigna angularis]